MKVDFVENDSSQNAVLQMKTVFFELKVQTHFFTHANFHLNHLLILYFFDNELLQFHDCKTDLFGIVGEIVGGNYGHFYVVMNLPCHSVIALV